MKSHKVVITTLSGDLLKKDLKQKDLQYDDNEKNLSYNPFEHRKVERPMSDLRSLANLLKSSLGSGILAMPLAFSCAGLGVGTIGTIIIGFVCTHCAKILVEQSQYICKVSEQPSLGYGETCQYAFSNGPKCLQKYALSFRLFSDFALAFTYLGACCVYVVLIANSAEQIVETNFENVDFATSTYCIMLTIPLVLIVQINNLKHLAPLSAIANFLLICICGISFYFVFEGNLSFEDRPLYTDIQKLPLFMSTVIFAMEGIGVVLPIENEMSKPQHFLGCPGVLNISMSIVVFLYGFLGFFGYVKYGSDVMGAITLNLDVHSMSAKVAKCFLIAAIYFTYPLQYYVSADIIWKYLQKPIIKDYHKVAQVSMLSLGVLLTVVLGACLPKIDAVMELVGSIFYSTLGLFIPALIEIVFQWERDLGRFKWKLWKNILIMTFSMVALVCGLSHAVASIINN